MSGRAGPAAPRPAPARGAGGDAALSRAEAEALERFTHTFAWPFAAMVVVMTPLTFLPAIDGPLHPTPRLLAAFTLTALHLWAACRPWADVVARPGGRRQLDAYPLAVLGLMALLPIVGKPQPAYSWAIALLAALAAALVSSRMLSVVVAIPVTVHVVSWRLEPGSFDPIDGVGMLGTTVAMIALVRVATNGYRDALRRHEQARLDAERHAALLRALAAGSQLGQRPDEVLQNVADRTADLGWDLCGLYVAETEPGMLRYGGYRGLPDELVDAGVPARTGVVGRVLEERSTVVAEDYGSLADAMPAYVELGLATVVGTPIWANDDLGGVIVVGSTDPRKLSHTDVQALELLADQAGRALELAERLVLQARTIDELEELDRLKRDFVSTVSHEMRTPLTVILGTAQTLESRWARIDEHQRIDLVGRLQNNARGLESVLTNLLDFARLESGRLDVRYEDVDLGALVADATGRLSSLLADHVLQVDVPGELVVRADGGLIERVVDNLLVNAARHTPSGTTVTVRVIADGGTVTVEVADDGPGIAPEDLGRLGQRFYRGGDANTRPTRGVGLGLAFCKQVLELHGTALDVTSVPGQGATFRFALPRAGDAVTP